jgi:hypothetical protein
LKYFASPLGPYAWALAPEQVAFGGRGFLTLIERAWRDFHAATGVQEKLRIQMVSLVLHGKGATVGLGYEYDDPRPNWT